MSGSPKGFDQRTCGDGVLQLGEECDDGAKNSDVLPDSCSTRCLLPRCGDAVLDRNFGEQCDQGLRNSRLLPDHCRLDCKNPHCGDGVKDNGEECDDGNRIDSDACSNACVGATHAAASSQPTGIVTVFSAMTVFVQQVLQSLLQLVSGAGQ
jgi:cysteine-rich repeat protein